MPVAVVILNWNGKRFLEKFVPVLLEKTCVPSEADVVVFVADNGSTDGSVEFLSENYPGDEVKIIRLDSNYGFTGGYNRAFAEIEKSWKSFDYYLLLNSDVEVTDGWLSSLVSFMDTHPDAAICSPKVRWYDKPEYFEHAGACGGMMDHFYFPYCRGRILSTVEKDEGQYDSAPEKVFWASGTSFMIRRTVWNDLGGLDESFFAHMEEIDLCWRAMLKGWEVWVVPSSKIFHVGGGTLPNDSPRKLYLNFRNNRLMMYKNLPSGKKWLILAERFCIDIAVAVMYFLKGKSEFCKAVFDAHRDFRRMKKEVAVTECSHPVRRPAVWIFFKALRHA